MMEKTLGGDRLGSGKKIKVQMHNYERSTHDLGYIWRSSMSAGTLVPFMVEVGLPGDTFDIDLNAVVKTHPTVGPLFGSFKLQLDVFQAPIRLYNSLLHNNKLGIGMKMSEIKLPQMRFNPKLISQTSDAPGDIDSCQVNPSALLAYLGIRGFGSISWDSPQPQDNPRDFNGTALLAYWDIYKNYYSNKQETKAYYISAEEVEAAPAISAQTIAFTNSMGQNGTVEKYPSIGTAHMGPTGLGSATLRIHFDDTPTLDLLKNIVFYLQPGKGGAISATALEIIEQYVDTNTDDIVIRFKPRSLTFVNWEESPKDIPVTSAPRLQQFSLSNIDTMREKILSHSSTSPFIINGSSNGIQPYIPQWLSDPERAYVYSQEGLGVKTYQSDIFNNWLSQEWIDGVDGINSITAIDTTGGSFTIDTLQLSKKVYDMLNRIAVSGGTYDDWLDAVYTHDRYTRAESPIYHGGLSKEIVFQEVVSNTSTDSDGGQPLGTLAGKGIMSDKHKGGKVVIHVDEPSYIIGIVSITPRVDYSQGNRWDVNLKTVDDLHKPALDQIGFQELITEQLAWWDTIWDNDNQEWIQRSAGKQPAWINYMTNYNRAYGNFAIGSNEMFMTLNRQYEVETETISGLKYPIIKDLTTYIDPAKYNFIFAQTSLDAQNFWTQIAVDITARRKMSAKVMPNL